MNYTKRCDRCGEPRTAPLVSLQSFAEATRVDWDLCASCFVAVKEFVKAGNVPACVPPIGYVWCEPQAEAGKRKAKLAMLEARLTSAIHLLKELL
jgi:hypothetical protein